MAVEFVFDPTFDRNLRHTRGSLNPVGDVIRRTTNDIARTARSAAGLAALNARVREETSSPATRYTAAGRRAQDEARAAAWAFTAYAEDLQPIMLGESNGVRTTEGRVVGYYPGSSAIEFGGPDPAVTLGSTGEHLVHTAHGILRTALLKGGLE